MKYWTTRARVGDDQVRHRNLLESDECPAEGIQSQQQQQFLLSTLANTPTMQMCGTKPFDKMRMYWNGRCWTIELEAIVKGTL
jgi:hypothetical protein